MVSPRQSLIGVMDIPNDYIVDTFLPFDALSPSSVEIEAKASISSQLPIGNAQPF